MAMNDKVPIYLALIRPMDFEDVPQKRMKIKTKTTTQVGIVHGFTMGEKCWMLQESGLTKDTKTMEDIKKDMLKKADPKVKGGSCPIS